MAILRINIVKAGTPTTTPLSRFGHMWLTIEKDGGGSIRVRVWPWRHKP
jgi:hypothetical protein